MQRQLMESPSLSVRLISLDSALACPLAH